MQYIHQLSIWPKFIWDHEQITLILASVRNRQGRLIGRMESLGFSLKSEAILSTLTLDVIKSSEIEGEILNPLQVRSSIARKLGINIGGLVAFDRNVDGVVEMMLDATQNNYNPLTTDRLFAWHASLFPTGRSGMHKINVGGWRDDAHGPMKVVSGMMGHEHIHFEAPEAHRIGTEMDNFLNWFNTNTGVEPVLKAGIAHLWFVTIHPFDDGNGRIARAITDMQLTRADGSKDRYYSMSVQIRQERNNYYDILEKTQKNINISKQGIDITLWLLWFLNCLDKSLDKTEDIFADIFKKAQFWESHSKEYINERQRIIINKLLDGIEGKLTSSKWAKIAKCSQDTAIRDISDLIGKGILIKDSAGGRSTNYSLSL